jgi:hypothetical protein
VAHKVKITNPHAAVIIWNYADRINASGAQNVEEIEQIIITSASLMSLSTSKRKSAPAGTFEFRLAPTYNWTARITPGSWCVLLMSQDKPIPQISASNLGSADPDLVKMLGRIDSCRVAVEVDQETGARRTVYVITGQDWGSVFDTKLYIDPIVRNNNLEKLSAVGHAARLGFDNFILEWTDNKHAALPTSTQCIDAMIKLWGAPLLDVGDALTGALGGGANPIQLDTNILFSSEAQFKLPVQVAQYMGLGGLLADVPGGASINFSKVIKRYDGVLSSYDTYSGDNQESNGFPDPASMYKVNTFWQILTDNCNPVVNELVTDMRWENGKANLALYKRAKPFINRSTFDGSDQPQVQKNISKFSNVRRIKLDLEDIITINAGTNWRDKFNFIEIRPQPQLNQTNFDTMVKIESQIIDRKAYEREGFKPLMQTAYYMPFNGSEPAPLEALQWKYLMKEWYFNTHLMLNGSMTIIGQNKYIQVGDNIQIPAGVLGPVNYNALQDGQAYMTAHVEAVNHNFSVTPEGGRSFATTIQFVRGVITKEDGTIYGGGGGSSVNNLLAGSLGSLASLTGAGAGDPLDGAIDRNAKDLPGDKEKNRSVFGSSTATDPDKSKLKGT